MLQVILTDRPLTETNLFSTGVSSPTPSERDPAPNFLVTRPLLWVRFKFCGVYLVPVCLQQWRGPYAEALKVFSSQKMAHLQNSIP